MSQELRISVAGIAEAVVEALATRGIVMPRLMNADQAATYLGMTKSALSTKVARKQIPCVRLDTTTRFDKLDLDELIEAGKQPAKG